MGTNTTGLQPFTSETASKAGKASAAARRARRDADVSKSRDAAKVLDTFASSFARDNLGGNAANVAQYILGRIGTGAIPVRNGDEAAALLRALVDIARLEEGQATSHTLTAHLSTEAAVARVAAIRDAAKVAIDAGDRVALATAEAAAHVPSGGTDAASVVGVERNDHTPTAADERNEQPTAGGTIEAATLRATPPPPDRGGTPGI
jgi:hypothetical protein